MHNAFLTTLLTTLHKATQVMTNGRDMEFERKNPLIKNHPDATPPQDR